jgi:hypothetical protein
MLSSPSIVVRNLKIKGALRDYDVPFQEGVNIIWGDVDSGKSSILSLIAYALGASSFDSYDEILEHGREVRLEVQLNEKPYIFQRSLLDKKQHVLCHHDEISDFVAPKVLAAEISGDAPDGYISFYVLDLLGLPRTKVRKSPSKTESAMDRIGFKDVLKFLYLKQKDVAADTLLNMSDPVRYIKNKQVLRYLLNIYNETVAEIEAELASHVKEQRDKIAERESIYSFLKKIEVDFQADYEGELQEKEGLVREIDEQITFAKQEHRRASLIDAEIGQKVKEAGAQLEEVVKDLEKKKSDFSSYLRLRNTYEKEIQSIATSLQLKNTFGEIQRDDHVKCPLCASAVDTNTTNAPFVSEHSLQVEENSLRQRLKGLKNFILQTEEEIADLESNRQKINLYLQNTVATYDQQFAREVSASIEVIQHLEKEKAEIFELRKVLERDIRVVRNFDDMNLGIANLEEAIGRIKLSLDSAREKQIDPQVVVERLSGIFASYMRRSGLQNMNDLRVDNKLDYYVRNKFYTDLTSGGLRTIASMGIFFSKLVYSIQHPCNLPTFLMLDTPGQNIGRNRDESENSEVADPAIYENVYKRIQGISELAARENVTCQIIVVDNDIPPFVIENPKFFISKRFSKSEQGYDRGLIADAKPKPTRLAE